ncbi:hypothetical protein WG947_07685 [Pontibacter sp. H259]|uniref:TerB family tellurite resistance protein n=1 Tax=Pontibacter sp. H259 TaxID=3133421 RepID=UPI0030BC10F4
MATSNQINNLLDTKQKKLSFFQNLVLVATADGYVDRMESDFLVMIGNQLELTEEDTRPIADNYATLRFIIPDDSLQRTVELQTLVMMMLQDGKLSEKEYSLCLDYTRRIGYTDARLNELIRTLGEGNL